LVTDSNPVAATTTPNPSANEQGFPQNTQGYLPTNAEQGIPLRQAIKSFLLSCKVEGKSNLRSGTIIGVRP
jgi:hypothetical protein